MSRQRESSEELSATGSQDTRLFALLLLFIVFTVSWMFHNMKCNHKRVKSSVVLLTIKLSANFGVGRVNRIRMYCFRKLIG